MISCIYRPIFSIVGRTLVLVLSGCAPLRAPVVSPVQLRVGPPSVQPAPAQGVNRCQHPRVAARMAEAPPTDTVVSCHPHDPATLDTIEAQLKERYPRKGSTMKTTVDVRCDPLREARRITAIGAEGHSPSLVVLTLDIPAGDGDVALDVARYSHPRDPYTDYTYAYSDDHTVAFEHASVPRRQALAAVETARAALVSHVHRVAILSKGRGGWGSASSRSSSWFRDIAVTDETRTLTAKMYGPQIGDDGKGESMSDELAWEALSALLELARPVTTPAPRTLEAVASALSRTGDVSWALTRLVGIAGATHDRTLVAPLVARLRLADDHLRVDLVSAIAKLTDFDVRTDENGAPRPIDVVAAEVLRECEGGVVP